MNVALALALLVMTAAVLGLGRGLARLGPAWLRPAHAPLWLVAGALVAGGAAIVNLLVDRPSDVLARALDVAADGPGARVTHLALALAALLATGLVVRVAFAALRRRRLDRPPVPALFLFAGVGPDGQPLRRLRARLFVGALTLALAAAAAGALAPAGVDSTAWAGLVAALTAAALATLPLPEAAAPLPAAAPAEAPPAEAPDGLDALLAALGRPPVSERRAPFTGAAVFPRRAVASALARDTLVDAPLGAGKTGAALEVALEDTLLGRDVLWIAPSNDDAREAAARFAAAPEALLLPALTATTPEGALALAADPHHPTRYARVVVDDADRLTGAELLALRDALATLAPTARRLALGVGVGAEVPRLLLGGDAARVTPAAHEPLPTAAVTRWLVERLPAPAPVIPRAVVRVLGPADAHRYLAAPPRYPSPTREVLALDDAARRRRAVAPPAPRPLVPRRAPARLNADAPAAPTATPIRTTRVRVVTTSQRARHRFLGPAELELWAARVELARDLEGERHHGPDRRRAHTRLGDPTPHGVVVDARVLVLPTADPVVLHTLVHVVRELLPWFFVDGARALGVTSARAAELGDAGGGRGALVVHDADADGGDAPADVAEREWEALLLAARALLAGCDCASHCARCCESTTCTTTPHNVELDRHRALAVLDALLTPAAAKKVA